MKIVVYGNYQEVVVKKIIEQQNQSTLMEYEYEYIN
jgi:hypothetical protein